MDNRTYEELIADLEEFESIWGIYERYIFSSMFGKASKI